MNELVKINSKNEIITDSITVSEIFKRNHKDVIESIKNLDCSEVFSQRNFSPSNYIDKQGKQRPCYEMTRDGFTFLAMGFQGKKAAEFKEAYIKAFNDMETKIKESMSRSIISLPDFTNPAEAARAWAEQFEQKQIAEQKVLELAPKAEFVDKYVESNGLFTLTAIAKNLKFKRKDLIEKLIADGEIFRRFKNLEPSARNVQLGYFEIKTGEKFGHAYDQMYVTTKGRAWIAKSYVSELAQ